MIAFIIGAQCNEKHSKEKVIRDDETGITGMSNRNLGDQDSELNEAVRNAKEPNEAILLIKNYEELLKGQHRKIINIMGKQIERKTESCLKSLGRTTKFLVVLDSANLIFILKLVYIHFYINFLY